MKRRILNFSLVGFSLLFFTFYLALSGCSEKFKTKHIGPFRIFMPHGSCKKNRCYALDEFGKSWKVKMSPSFQSNLKLGQSYTALLDPVTRTLYLDLETYKATVQVENKPENTQTYILFVKPNQTTYHESDTEDQESEDSDAPQQPVGGAATTPAPGNGNDSTSNTDASGKVQNKGQ